MARIVCVTLVLFAASVQTHSQEASRGAVEVKGVFGYAGFPDESMLHHFVAGGSIRTYLTSRLSFEPEFLYMHGPGWDRDLLVIPNLAFDFARSARVKSYLIGGAGLLAHRDGIPSAPGRPTFFWGNGWTFGGGIGVKVLVTEKIFLAPEFRIGWEPAIRSTVSLGYRF